MGYPYFWKYPYRSSILYMFHGARIPEPTKGQSLVDLDYLGVWNFFLRIWKKKPSSNWQHRLLFETCQAAKDGDHRVPWNSIRFFFIFFPGEELERLPKRHPELRGSKLYTFIYPIYVDTCGWFRNPANQLRWLVYLIIYQVLYIPSGAPLCSCAPIPSAVYVLTHCLEH